MPEVLELTYKFVEPSPLAGLKISERTMQFPPERRMVKIAPENEFTRVLFS